MYILLIGWVVVVKNCDRGLENAARSRGHGQHFQARGHSFSLCGPTISLYTYFTIRDYSKISFELPYASRI